MTNINLPDISGQPSPACDAARLERLEGARGREMAGIPGISKTMDGRCWCALASPSSRVERASTTFMNQA